MNNDNEEETLDHAEAMREIAALEANGAKVQAFSLSADSGGGILRGMSPMFEEVSRSATDSEEERRVWWRSFCVEAHLMALEQVGIDEAMDSFYTCAKLVAERIEESQTRKN